MVLTRRSKKSKPSANISRYPPVTRIAGVPIRLYTWSSDGSADSLVHSPLPGRRASMSLRAAVIAHESSSGDIRVAGPYVSWSSMIRSGS